MRIARSALGARCFKHDEHSANLLVGTRIQQITLFFDGRSADVQGSATDTVALDLAKRAQS